MLRSALSRLTSIPPQDIEALRKMWSGELPPVRPLGSRPVLIVVDMNEAFVRDEYPTGWAATGEPCVTELVGLIAAARRAGAPVIYTTSARLPHPAQIGGWARGRPVFPLESDGRPHEIVPELVPAPDDIVLVKPKPSAFFGTQLHAVLNALRADTLVITGMTTSGCVRATVNDAFMLNYPVFVPLECVADRSQLSHQVELFDMGAKYADVVYTTDLIEELAPV
jgi:nicotinamidase-related amidase